MELEKAIEIWKKMVEVQMHFNDIGLRIRNFTLTIYTFILASTGFLISGEISNWIIGLLNLFGVLIIFSFFNVDKYWYHLYLKATSKKVGEFESKWFGEYPEMKMSTEIGDESKTERKFLFWKIQYDSKSRFSWFYYPLMLSLLIVSMYFFFFNTNSLKNVSKDKYDEILKEKKITTNEIKLLILKNKMNEYHISSFKKRNDSLQTINLFTQRKLDSLLLVNNKKKLKKTGK